MKNMDEVKKRKKVVRHMKTANLHSHLHFNGDRIEIKTCIPEAEARRLCIRLAKLFGWKFDWQ